MEINKESIIKPKYMAVYSGRMIDVFNVTKEEIDIDDISHSLSNLCRYGGHCLFHYSVAQHSVRCSYEEGTREEQLSFLLHDGSEAYVNDLVRPIKHRPEFDFYRKQEEKIQEIIFDKYNLEYPFSERIHEVDNKILLEEISQIVITHKEVVEKSYELDISLQSARKKLRNEKLKNCSIPIITPEQAKKQFLDRFYELY